VSSALHSQFCHIELTKKHCSFGKQLSLTPFNSLTIDSQQKIVTFVALLEYTYIIYNKHDYGIFNERETNHRRRSRYDWFKHGTDRLDDGSDERHLSL
jgi:hypothetical protein